MSKFSYSDHEDKLTNLLITQNYDSAYWGRSEDRVLAEGKAYISEKFGHGRLKSLHMLDLGCGMGRLIPEFAEMFCDVTALEPDDERCGEARKLVESAPVANAKVFHGVLNEYLSEQKDPPCFDVVLCSHIFQHFTHGTMFGIWEDLKRCTNDQTVFLFTTTYTSDESNRYSAEGFDGEDRVSLPVDLEGFEKAVEDDRYLAVCRFARPWMEARMSEYGLCVRKFSCYHFFGEKNAENDGYNTLDPEKRKLARDAFYLCEWKEQPDGKARKEEQEPMVSGKISFMQYYYLKDEKGDALRLPPEEELERTSGKKRKVMEDFATAQGFLYGAGLHFPAKRYVIDGLNVRREGLPITDSHAILCFYPGSFACQVTVSITLDPTPVRNCVFLHQIQCARGVPFDVNGEQISIPDLNDRILQQYGIRSAVTSSSAFLIEVNTFGNRTDSSDITDREARCFYGMLTGDEGWSHVPAELARARMDSSWTSRDFVKLIVFANNYVLLNFNRDKTHDHYMQVEHGFADHYWGGLNPYFTMDADTAGVNHGVYFSVETGMIIKTTTDRLLNSRPDLTKKNGLFIRDEIMRNKKFRADMIRTLNKVEMVNISELGELDTLVVQSLGATQRVESIRYLLELLESDLDLMYQTSTNRFVNLLTILGLLFALLQVVLAIFPAP